MFRSSDVQREVVRVHLLSISTDFTSIQWQFIALHIHSVTQGIICYFKTRVFLAATSGLQERIFSRLFEILRTATISVVMSVCPSLLLSVRLSINPSVRMEQLGYHQEGFSQNFIFDYGCMFCVLLYTFV
jgi:hypothetical protein